MSSAAIDACSPVYNKYIALHNTVRANRPPVPCFASSDAFASFCFVCVFSALTVELLGFVRYSGHDVGRERGGVHEVRAQLVARGGRDVLRWDDRPTRPAAPGGGGGLADWRVEPAR